MSVLSKLFVHETGEDGLPWLIDWLAGAGTDAGETVTPATAMGLSAYYACLRNISEDIGKLPLFVYERLKAGGKEKRPEHWLYSKLHDEPNPFMTSMAWRETLTAHAMAWGGGFAEIEPDKAGKPMWFNPIHPSRVGIKRTKTELVYPIRTDDISTEEAIVIPQRRMIHIHGLGGSGISGYSLSVVAAGAIGLGLAMQKFGSRFFNDGTRLSGVLKHPGDLTDTAKANLRKGWMNMYTGADNTHNIAILDEGIEWEQLSIPPEEAQFLESRHLTVEEIARFFRMPPHKIQHLLRATYSNITHQSMEYVTDTLMPWAVRWEQELKRKLLADEPEMLAEFLFAGLLRGDPGERGDFYTKQFMVGGMNINEIREAENRNPIGPEGDIYFVPANMVPVESLLEEPEPEPEPAEEEPPPEEEPPQEEEVPADIEKPE